VSWGTLRFSSSGPSISFLAAITVAAEKARSASICC
jgi:hypothetical protein